MRRFMSLDVKQCIFEHSFNCVRPSMLIPAYEEPLLWEGHSSMIEESARQLPQGVKPDAVFCCVGGAGLLGGVILGCKAAGWDDGKDFFNQQ